MKRSCGYVSLCLLISLVLIAPGAQAAQSFDRWLDEVRVEAKKQGISNDTIEASLQQLTPNSKVVELDQKQPESTRTFEEYMALVVTQTRKDRAVSEYKQHQKELEAIGRHYGVQPEYIVALWGIESNFGDNMGSLGVIRSLATLAYDGRRSSYFRGELINALKIIDQGHISADEMVGSWAGAMGQCQFMPSSFLSYAEDGDKDGRKDIWATKSDVFASVANYLSSVGWDDSVGWGAAVDGASRADVTSYKNKSSLRAWKQRGMTTDTPLNENTSVALLSGNQDDSGPYFVVSNNYDNILKWNRSRYFAIAVGTLADHIAEEVR